MTGTITGRVKHSVTLKLTLVFASVLLLLGIVAVPQASAAANSYSFNNSTGCVHSWGYFSWGGPVVSIGFYMQTPCASHANAKFYGYDANWKQVASDEWNFVGVRKAPSGFQGGAYVGRLGGPTIKHVMVCIWGDSKTSVVCKMYS